MDGVGDDAAAGKLVALDGFVEVGLFGELEDDDICSFNIMTSIVILIRCSCIMAFCTQSTWRNY